jgi:hypothetical protein
MFGRFGEARFTSFRAAALVAIIARRKEEPVRRQKNVVLQDAPVSVFGCRRSHVEEVNLGRVHEGDPAEVKLMGYCEIVRGHVDSIARAVNVPNQQGVATVNPIFTWVRLAQRIPVRIHIDAVPKGAVLSAGMTPGRSTRGPGRKPNEDAMGSSILEQTGSFSIPSRRQPGVLEPPSSGAR